MNVRRAAFLVLALTSIGCGDDAGAEDRAPATHDAGRRDAGRDASKDAKAPSDIEEDAGDDDPDDAPIEDAGRANDGGRDAARADAASDAAVNDAAVGASGETGRNVGATAAHNAVRAMVETTMSLPAMTWSPEIAAYAQEWADHLAQTACDAPAHRSSADLRAKGYGENLFATSAYPNKPNSTPQSAVGAWAKEVQCYTYGPFMEGDACNVSCYQGMNSDGCGHYTQIVWRKSTQVGCGVASCVTSKKLNEDIWICNYSPAGNFVGQKPY